MLWTAQLGTVLLLGALAWLLPDLAGVPPRPGVAAVMLIAGAAAIPLAPIAARLLGIGRPRADVKVHAAGVPDTAAQALGGAQAHFILLLALAELPALLGLGHAVLGGNPLYAVALVGASALLLWIYRPVA
jgi:hypothetical protein